MSRLRLAKKLQPAKRVWKSFSNTLQHLLNRKIPKAIKTTIQRLLSTTFHSLRYFIVPSKASRSLTAPSSSSSLSRRHVQVHLASTSSAVSDEHIGNKCHGEREAGRDSAEERSSGLDSVEDAWRRVVARSPVLRVDERAEEFIHKFREDMKLQKERSLLEFEEMLARSA